MKRLIAVAVLLVLLLPARASAHILVRDTNGDSGMIVHVQPDDDPIAGLPASFFFDMANAGITTDSYTFELTITDDKGASEVVETKVAGPTSASASYTFPSQGLYDLKLKATAASGAQIKTFEFSQLVSRGAVASPLDEPRYALAEFLLVLSSFGLVILVIIVIIRRKQIAAFTKKV